MKSSAKKQALRAKFRKLRDQIPARRREEAAAQLWALLSGLLSPSVILSFSSMRKEIDLSMLNRHLSREKRLCLPRVEGEGLKLYCVEDLDRQLELSKLGIWEPSRNLCAPCPLETVQCVLVPGLAFDQHHMRLGYGKGHYDRLIAQLRELPTQAHLVGVGFQEQLYGEDLPAEPHDQALNRLLLV